MQSDYHHETRVIHEKLQPFSPEFTALSDVFMSEALCFLRVLL